MNKKNQIFKIELDVAKDDINGNLININNT